MGYCDLLLARFGLIEQMKNLDDGLAESISSLIWVAPRLLADVPELKTVSDQFVVKYGKPYGLACRENSVGTVSEKLMHKMSVQAPPKLTVEKYLIEIAKYYNVDYQPDPQVTLDQELLPGYPYFHGAEFNLPVEKDWITSLAICICHSLLFKVVV